MPTKLRPNTAPAIEPEFRAPAIEPEFLSKAPAIEPEFLFNAPAIEPEFFTGSGRIIVAGSRLRTVW